MATATKVRMRFRLASGKLIRPGFWFGDPGTDLAVPVAQHQAMVDAGRAAVASSGLMAGFDDSVVFEEMEAQNFTRVASEEDPPASPWTWEALTTTTESAGADIPGTQTADSLPPQNAYVISIKSATPGPSGRNRFYGPPPVDSEVNALGVIDSARVTQLQADHEAVWTAIVAAAGSSYVVVVASAQDNQLYPFVTGTVKNVVRTQRRRAS